MVGPPGNLSAGQCLMLIPATDINFFFAFSFLFFSFPLFRLRVLSGKGPHFYTH
jgi:hypothetical protein